MIAQTADDIIAAARPRLNAAVQMIFEAENIARAHEGRAALSFGWDTGAACDLSLRSAAPSSGDAGAADHS